MKQKMRAVRLFAPGDVRCVEVDVPTIEKEDDVIVKVKSCGVCGSDIVRVMEKGAYISPITIGHEFAGEIVEKGSGVSKFEIGDRVAIMPLVPCGECKYCKIGQQVMCDNYSYYGSRIDGAMAEYIRISQETILKIPSGVDYEGASMTDPASVALHALRKINLQPGQTIVVFGLGAIGLLTMQWLKSLGCTKVIVVDIIDEKLELAKNLGADICINGKKENVVQTIMDATDGEGADAAIEIAGNKITQIQALDSVRKMGTVIYCGISYEDLTIPIGTLNKILRGELNLIGSWNSSIAPLPINEWESALKFIGNGKLKVNPLITHRFRLEDCKECFDMVYNKTETFNKVLFKPED